MDYPNSFPGADPNQQWVQQGQTQLTPPPVPAEPILSQFQEEEGDTSRRPPNAFILYSQSMRTQVRSENPSLSNTEVSSLLGKMWKDVPNEVKLQYKQKAQALQEEFKKAHPGYTYRKARRKRALNELLTKTQNLGANFPYPDAFGVQQGYSGIPYPMGGLVPGVPMQPNIPPQMPQTLPGIPPGSNQGVSVYPNLTPFQPKPDQ